MPGANGTRVFISYARKDAAELAQRLQQDLTEHGLEPWLDTRQISGGATWTTEIEQALDTSGTVLALLTPASYRSEICRAEQLRALRKHKHLIPLLAHTNADSPLHLEPKNHRDFTKASSYASQFKLLLDDILRGTNGAILPEHFRQTYVTAPPLPRNYIPRPDALASLRAALVTDGRGPSIALTALRGMGGIGKTVLAQALCHDEVVQQAFPDGIVWTTVGKESTDGLVTNLREIGKGLNDDLAAYDTPRGCINRYRNTIRDKAALVVIDGVWLATALEPFRAESQRSRLLFTTRDASIAAAVGAEEHLAELLTEPQSREVLARWSGLNGNDLPHEADALIRECGRLPLALAMIGAMLRGKPRGYWQHVHNLLQRADLTKIRAQFPGFSHAGLLPAIQISIDALEAEPRNRYLSLAVLLDDMSVPPVIQETLWNLNRWDVLETSEQFTKLSLAQCDSSDGAIRLHGLQLEYVRAQYPDRESLDLIHGALRLAAHVIEKDPHQFASQIVGRLMPYDGQPAIQSFTASLTEAAPRPWIRTLQPTLERPGTGLLRTLAGHSDFVNGVALTSNGRRAVSASCDHTLKVWDLDSGRELRTLTGHSNAVACVAVTANGRRAVSASYDHTLKVWDLDSGRELRTLTGHSNAVACVAVTSDGRAVSASNDHTLKVWDLDSGRELRTLTGHSNVVTGVAVTPDGRRAVSVSNDHTLKVWNLDSGLELRTLAAHSERVTGVAVTPDGRRAVSASLDHTLKVWDLKSGYELRTLTGHSDWVTGVALTSNGRRAVSASCDQTLKVWNLDSGHELRTLTGHSSSVTGVAVTSDGRRAVSASDDDTLKVWDLDSGRELRPPEGHSSSVTGVAVTPDKRRAVSASDDDTLKVWDLDSGRELRTLIGHSHGVTGVAVTPDGRRAVSASYDQTLKVWNLDSGYELRTLTGHSDWVTGVAVTPDGRRAVSASRDQTLKVWDLKSGRELRTLTGHSGFVTGVALTPDGRWAVSASRDQTLKVWDLKSGREIRTLTGHSDFVTGVAVTPDGRRAVSASDDQTLKVWDLDSGHELRTWTGHSNLVTGVAATPDGPWAVSASHDHTLKVWNLESGQPIATFTCDACANCCVFATGRLIVAGDQAGRVHFLSLEL